MDFEEKYNKKWSQLKFLRISCSIKSIAQNKSRLSVQICILSNRQIRLEFWNNQSFSNIKSMCICYIYDFINDAMNWQLRKWYVIYSVK